MDLGFQTWKDWLEVLVVPMGLGAAGGLYQLLKRRAEEKSFQRVVLRELEEIGPYPPEPIPDGQWQQHQKKQFVHQKIFDDPSQSRDLILRLPEDLVYFVNQLWASKAIANSEQWLHFLGELCDPKYDTKGRIKKAKQRWETLIQKYNALQQGSIGDAKDAQPAAPGDAPKAAPLSYHVGNITVNSSSIEITILTA